MDRIELVAAQSKDVNMIEIWSANKEDFWCIVHIDMFLGTSLYSDLNEGLEVNLTVKG